MRKSSGEAGKNSHPSKNDSNEAPYEALEKFIRIFQREYKVDLSDVLDSLEKQTQKEIRIPASVFNRELSCSEAVCKYLKENLGLRYHEIARLLNRNDRTVWITCRNASRKLKSKLTARKSRFSIPVSVIADRRLSVLEAIVSYLKSFNLTYHEIALVLKRDERNIWTLHNRAKKKWKEN